QLSRLGGKRIVPIQKCDVDYESEAEHWFDSLLKELNHSTETKTIEKPVVTAVKTPGKTIYQGTVLSHINLNDRGSNKETWHIEIAAEALEYEAGDSIGIVPKNREEIADLIIEISKVDPNRNIEYKKESRSIKDLLVNKLNISNLNDKTIKRYVELVKQEIAFTKIDLLELLISYPVQNTDQFVELIQLLNPQSPRLYTVSSSPLATEGEVHITVARDIFWANEKKQYGLCSDFLSEIKVNGTIEFFVQKNKRFKLPAKDKDIIMIGPGTGIAAFRGFLAERDAVGATGRNWLFFGEQHFATDFLYQTEIQNWETTGTLTKVNVAFSRDQKEKIYVQQRMLEHGAELFEWLQGGAYFYVCGKKDPMSNDVEQALIQIIEQYGKMTIDEAKAYIHVLKESHRYHKDVY
ncbi:MAG: sulfite reductase, partial [Bacteroidetes bacterium]|nr:sulfite reductase [Bacteroidota bacterium]